MSKGLLIGNGLNIGIGGISWGDLLKNVADEYGVSYNSNIPMPMEFERIVNEYLSGTGAKKGTEIYAEIKKKITKQIKGVTLPSDAIQRRLPALGLDCILTTNYDNLLEQAYDSTAVYSGSNRLKYTFQPTSVIDGTSFFHPHGILESTQSICLGYEHYMGQVQHLRDELNKKDNNESDKMGIIKVLRGDPDAIHDSWGEKFYTTNLGIIGLGLYESESDLWWLITHRASLYYQDYIGIGRKLINNTIIYYDVLDERPIETAGKTDEEIDVAKQKRMADRQIKENKYDLLRNSHVEVVIHTLKDAKDTYADAYNKFLDDFERRSF